VAPTPWVAGALAVDIARARPIVVHPEEIVQQSAPKASCPVGPPFVTVNRVGDGICAGIGPRLRVGVQTRGQTKYRREAAVDALKVGHDGELLWHGKLPEVLGQGHGRDTLTCSGRVDVCER